MSKITLFSPYFGNKFPCTFPALIDSMIFNSDISFVIPTNINLQLPKKATNITIIKTNLHDLNNRVDQILGYHAKITTPYKLVDFKPLYGRLFSSYIDGSDWWGYFDSDIIFGNISDFLTDTLLANYDRIFTHGHLTLYKNCDTMNNLWNTNFSLKEVPQFKEVARNKSVFAFDEWGWGKNKGRGLSYAISKTKIVKQFDNPKWFADLLTDNFKFKTTSQKYIDYFMYDKGHVIGYHKEYSEEFLYVHFQKRNMFSDNYSTNLPIYITPNILSNQQHVDNSNELDRWKSIQQKRKFKMWRTNLNFSYLKRRLHFFTSERNTFL